MSLMSSSSRRLTLGLALLTFLAFGLAACGADRHAPAYPESADPELEDTDLYQYVAGDEDEAEEDYGSDEEPFEAMPDEAADGADEGSAASAADAGTPPQDPAPVPPTGG